MDNWFENLKKQNEKDLHFGISMGWWEFVENGIPIPFAIKLRKDSFPPNATMANVLAHVGIFDSIKQAKKSGRNGPITSGEFRFKKKSGGLVRVVIE